MKNNIKELRKKKNIAQHEMASMIGVSRQTINAIENEKYDPSLKLAIKIALLLDTPIETLFDLNDLD
ncbi:helix-turn-helix transcriptional regulator [Anaeromicropila herbilytica]|uniref:Transcriptional regulator n=1 Tax=Anaeromicropila herbilytica TaxID=2785025 RepID=A0A7R7EKF6_9FIRM|nr:helix-turn-helix transcriptional regulator [Anaeromicropila herbilytica]BCN30107.1 transcriptional regulator [Anaeromicropila herbilytica]